MSVVKEVSVDLQVFVFLPILDILRCRKQSNIECRHRKWSSFDVIYIGLIDIISVTDNYV